LASALVEAVGNASGIRIESITIYAGRAGQFLDPLPVFFGQRTQVNFRMKSMPAGPRW